MSAPPYGSLNLGLDWSRIGARRLIIVSHGLEGNTGRSYMRGMVRAFNNAGWDALAWNYRGCSGEPNRLLRAYHSGATDDLDTVVRHALADFDDRYTAPLNGFRDAEDYWTQCSCRRFLSGIRHPALLVNALDDPFLGPQCYPDAEARDHPYLTLETPAHGAHVGFLTFSSDGSYRSEQRAVAFLGGG